MIYTIICICTEIAFSRNSPYPRTPPGEGTDINRGLLMISILSIFYRNCTFLEFLQNLHHSLKFSIVLFLSFPGIPSKPSPTPGIFQYFFCSKPLEFSNFKPPWNSVVLNRRTDFFWKSLIV